MGENLHESMRKQTDDGDMDGEQFMKENISAMFNEAKPYKSIIKRYWTEEEVSS